MSIIENGTEFIVQFKYNDRYERFVFIRFNPDDNDLPYLFQSDNGNAVWIAPCDLPKEVKKALEQRILRENNQEDQRRI